MIAFGAEVLLAVLALELIAQVVLAVLERLALRLRQARQFRATGAVRER